MPLKITEKWLADAPAGFHWDTACPGLGMHVFASGVKSWVLRYRIRGNNGSRRETLGRWPRMPLVEARVVARARLVEIERQGAPAKRQHCGRLFSGLASVFLEREEGKKRRADDARRLYKYILPALGRLPAAQIAKADVANLHADIARTHPVTANRVVELVRLIFNRAVEWGLIPENAPNPAGRVRRAQEPSRTRVLSADEVRRLALVLKEYPDPYVPRYLSLLLLTAARKNELLRLRWEQIDFTAGTIRWSATKAGQPHVLRLSGAVRRMLEDLRAVAPEGDPWVFPGRRPGKPRQSVHRAWRTILKRAGLADVRLHDLRRTAATWLGEMGFSAYEIQTALNHASIRSALAYVRLGGEATAGPMEGLAERMGNLLADGDRKP